MATPPATNYTQLYGGMDDIHQGDYAAFYAPFSAGAADNNAQIRDTFFAASRDYPKIILAVTGTPARIVALHRPSRVASPLGVVSPWNNQRFCFKGDISSRGGYPSLVNWPADAFARTVNVRVKTAAAMTPLLAADPALVSLGPFDAAEPETEEIQTRMCMPAPAQYSHLVLNRVHTPRSFYDQVISQIEADGNLVACRELANWSRVAFHLHDAGGALGNVVPTHSGALTAPVADAELLDRAHAWVVEDIPSRQANTNAGIQQQMVQQNQNLQQLIADQANRANRRHTVSSRYPSVAVNLRLLCNAVDDAGLPSLWDSLANGQRTERTPTVENALDARATMRPGWSPPVATPELVEMIINFRFAAPDVDVLTAGPSVFLLTSSDSVDAPTARDRQATFAMLHAGNVQPAMDQLAQLVDNAPRMPRDLIGLMSMLRAYSILLDVMFGEGHPMCLALYAFVVAWDGVQPQVNQYFSPDGGIAAFVPLVLRKVQLLTQNWINEALRTRVLPAAPPRYQDIIQYVSERMWQNFPPIPARYVRRPALPAPALPPANEGGPPAGNAGRQGQQAAGQQGPAAAARAGPAVNPTPIPGLIQRYAQHQGRLRALTEGRGDQLPTVDAGGEQLCLAYHLTGNCNTLCRRRGSHRPLTATEQRGVEDFLTAANL